MQHLLVSFFNSNCFGQSLFSQRACLRDQIVVRVQKSCGNHFSLICVAPAQSTNATCSTASPADG